MTAVFSKEWCLKMAELEGDSEIGAGLLALMCDGRTEPTDLMRIVLAVLTAVYGITPDARTKAEIERVITEECQERPHD